MNPTAPAPGSGLILPGTPGFGMPQGTAPPASFFNNTPDASLIAAAAQFAHANGLVPSLARGTLAVPIFNPAVPDGRIGEAFANEATRAQVCAALNAASRTYGDALLRNATLSAPGAFPARDGAVADVFFQGSNEPVDLSWTFVFDVEDYRNTTEEDFELVNVRDAVYFRIYANGERVELGGISGDVMKFPFSLVGGGFQYLMTWIQDAKFWRIANGLRGMETGYAKTQAQLAWTILTHASGLVSQTRDAAGANVIEKDVNTVNAAATEILADVYETDKDIPASPAFVLAYNNLTPGYGARAAAMLAAQYGIANAALGSVKLEFPVLPIGSPHVPTGGMYLALPKRRLKTGLRMDLQVFEKFEPMNYSDARIGWGRYTHVRGDAKQVRFIPLS